MRVGYDLTFAGADAGGTGTYARELRRELGSARGVEMADLSSPRRGLPASLFWLAVGAGAAARSRRVSVMHVPAPVPPLVAAPMVLTVHDVSVFDFPDDFTAEWRHFQLRLLPALARRAAFVVTGTHHARAGIAERLGVPAERIVVTPYGTPRAPVEAPSTVRRGRTLVFAGAPLRRKNLEVVLRALAEPAGRRSRARLAITGAGPTDFPRHSRLVAELGLAARVDWLGRLTGPQLEALYASAGALVYPSRHEGFGFPPLEAMGRGLPVLAAGASCLPEVLGEGAELIDPGDPEAWARAIERVLDDEVFAADLVRRGRLRSAIHSWARCAELTVGVYERAAAV